MAVDVNLEIIVINDPSEILEGELTPLGGFGGAWFKHRVIIPIIEGNFQAIGGELHLGIFLIGDIAGVDHPTEVTSEGIEKG